MASEYRCFVEGVASSVDEQALERAFSEFGHVIEVKINSHLKTESGTGFAFVKFGSEKEMMDAIEGLNGHDLEGSNIIVKDGQAQYSFENGSCAYNPRHYEERFHTHLLDGRPVRRGGGAGMWRGERTPGGSLRG